MASYSDWGAASPEIVEINDDSKGIIENKEIINDVFVAVGKNDLDVVQWALDHFGSSHIRVILVHVFPCIPYIPTPVGMLSRSQLGKDTVQIYIKEENNRRRNILQKYIRLCTDAKVMVDTMLIESNAVAKALLDLIPIVNITTLVIGSKRPNSSWRLNKGINKGEFIKKNAPEFCQINIVCNRKKFADDQEKATTHPVDSAPASYHQRTEISQRKFCYSLCFPVKFTQ